MCVYVSLWQNVILETPTAAGATAKTGLIPWMVVIFRLWTDFVSMKTTVQDGVTNLNISATETKMESQVRR